MSFRRLVLSLMTTYEVNAATDAADLDVRSVMELDAASSEVGIMQLDEVSGAAAAADDDDDTSGMFFCLLLASAARRIIFGIPFL